MEEKKLTDEEIVKALEMNCLCVAYGKENCESCLLFDKDCKILPNAVVELIQRQKAEIERLTEEVKQNESISQSYIEVCDINAELQKQVDELKKPINGKFKDNNALNKAYETLEKEFTRRSQRLRELQNKVDELENRFENKACCNMSENCSMVQQGVKDTAKEIYTQMLEWIPVAKGYNVFIHNIEQWLKEKYDVEVE